LVALIIGSTQTPSHNIWPAAQLMALLPPAPPAEPDAPPAGETVPPCPPTAPEPPWPPAPPPAPPAPAGRLVRLHVLLAAHSVSTSGCCCAVSAWQAALFVSTVVTVVLPAHVTM